MIAARKYYRFLATAIFVILAARSPGAIPERLMPRPLAKTHLNSAYGKVPLAFEPNVGQTDARVRFLSRGGGMTTFFTHTETVMVLSRNRKTKNPDLPGLRRTEPRELEQTVVRMKFEGASQAQGTTGLEQLPGVSNYFIGNDPSKWRTDVPHFARIESEGVYPGIDLVWYGSQQRLEYDFIVAPGADPKQIRVAYDGVESVDIDAGGNLVLRTKLGEMRQQKPRVYQEVGGRQVEVDARYSIAAHNRMAFALAGYDRTRELRIDPVVLVYSTYLGGNGSSGDFGAAIAIDASGSAYVTGSTNSTNFPTLSAFQAQVDPYYTDAFVTKLTPAGNALVYSTYLGGNGPGEVSGSAIAVNASGAAYVTGATLSPNFPTQSPFQTTGGIFVTKLTPAGNALAYSTYLGGAGPEHGNAIAVDAAGSAYVTGTTTATNFPLQSPFQATKPGSLVTGNGFVTKLAPAGNALVYSTYLGGSSSDSGTAIAVDAAGSAYVTGSTSSPDFPTQAPYQATLRGLSNAFIAKFTPAGNALVYSTYLGGTGGDGGAGIAVDDTGSAYIAGGTNSIDFPTQSPFQGPPPGGPSLGTPPGGPSLGTLPGGLTLPPQSGGNFAFVTKLTPSGGALAYSTYLGGANYNSSSGIAIDASGSAYITGNTTSFNFPTQFPYQATLPGVSDLYVTKFTPAGNALVYSTYLGGSGDDTSYGIAVDAAGTAYVVGTTQSNNFPTQSPFQATLRAVSSAFVTKLMGPSPFLSIVMAHNGNFAPGQNGATYTVTVSSAIGAAPTNSSVTVTETVPPGVTLVSMAGTGWTCPAGGITCTRNDVLNGGASYPAIAVNVNVPTSSATLLTNYVTLSGGGSPSASASDTAVVSTCAPTIASLSPPGVAGAAGTLSIALNNGSCGWTATADVPWLTPAPSGTGNALTAAVTANTTGAQRSGTITVSGQTVTVTQAANTANQIPSLVSLSPFQGQGPNATLTLVYSHPNGWSAIQSAQFIINPNWETGSRNGGCYVQYAPGNAQWTLIADDGVSTAGVATLGAATTLSNSQCSLNVANSSVTSSGTTLTMVASLTFTPAFTGQRHIWMQASDYNNISTNWLVYGVWFPATTAVSATSWYQIYDPNSKSYLYSSDPNEYATLGAEGFTKQGSLGLVMNTPASVAGISNIAWYRVFVNSTSSHFWTSDRNEFLTLINQQQAYVGEGVAAFVMPYINAAGQVSPQVTNTVPFNRAVYSGANLHYWTVQTTPFNGTYGEWPAGYVGEGIACYIFPNGGAQFSSDPATPTTDDGSPAVASVSNGASYVRGGVVSPGQILNIHGRHLGGAVLLNGIPAEVISARDNEIRVAAPQSLAGATEAALVMENQGRRTKPITLGVVAANPAIFAGAVFGRGQAQALNEDGATNSSQHAALRGSVVTLFATGFNAADQPIEAHLGGYPAQIVSTHLSSVRAGTVEVQVSVPEAVAPAPFQPIVLRVGNLFTQPGVGVAIQ